MDEEDVPYSHPVERCPGPLRFRASSRWHKLGCQSGCQIGCLSGGVALRGESEYNWERNEPRDHTDAAVRVFCSPR